MKQQLEQAVAAAVKDLFGVEQPVELTRPDEQFGDYATNIALQMAKKIGENPREVAEALAVKIRESSADIVETVSVAGPGFLNLTLTSSALVRALEQKVAKPHVNKQFVIEYSCPNYFKELHAGHLYQTIVGDVIARLIEKAGATVHRANFGGDVGLHVAKAIYGMNKRVNGSYDNQDYSKVVEYMHSLTTEERPKFLAETYVLGSSSYEEDSDKAKYWVETLNGELYHTVFSDVAEEHADQASKDQREIFRIGREWSRQYFDSFYAALELERQEDGSFFKYYPESETAEIGLEMVRTHTQGFPMQEGDPIFTNSDGAVVLEGEKHGLHTRVFITKQGLPTYEAKDLGVISMELADFNFDHRILLTGNDQAEYMKVVWKAADLIKPGLLDRMTHLTHGTIRFGDGKKMSSRLGNVTRAVDVIGRVRELVAEMSNEPSERTVLGAVKYEFLKYRLGGDIAFDPNESVALEGNSGPYLQYAHARARSILAKTSSRGHSERSEESIGQILRDAQDDTGLELEERSLLRKMSEYAEVVERATNELMPHHICTYLYELAQKFNQFYEHNRVIGDDRETVRLALVQHYADTLKNGLELLGIAAPEKM